MLGDNYPWVTHISTPLLSSSTDSFSVQLYFQGERPRKIEVVFFPEQRADLFTIHYLKGHGSLQGKCRTGLCVAHYERFRFPKLSISQIWRKLTARTASTWSSQHYLCGATPGTLRKTNGYMELMLSPWVNALCFLPRSLISPSRTLKLPGEFVSLQVE